VKHAWVDCQTLRLVRAGKGSGKEKDDYSPVQRIDVG